MIKIINSAVDISTAADLLSQNGLPLDGFPEDLSLILGAFKREKLVGCAALEIHGEHALLRSVVTEKTDRGAGIGTLLTRAALTQARNLDLKYVFLLTETAVNYFPRFGFKKISRDQVPVEVKQSVEFRSACPESAAVLALDLSKYNQEKS